MEFMTARIKVLIDPCVTKEQQCDHRDKHTSRQEEDICVHLYGSTTRALGIYTHRIIPFSFPHPISSPPTQNGFRAFGRSRPSILFSCPSANLTPFSRRATSNRGIAAAVPLRVCANGSGVSDSVAGRYRI